MSELIMLIGLPGSGKSTFIKKLNQHNDYVVISSDDIIEELAALEGKTYTDVFDKHVGFATKEMFRRAEEAIRQNKKVIWDQTNMNSKNRRKKLAMFPKEYVKKAVIFSIDNLELKRRLDKRAKETGKTIPAHIMKSMANSYEAPTKAEGFSQIFWVKN